MVELGGSKSWLDRAVVAGTAVVGGTDSDRREEASPSSGGDEETEGVDSVVVVVVVVVAGLWPFLPNFGPEWLGRQLPPRRLGCISL